MNTKALIMLLLLTFCLALMASENLSEAEEQWQKTQELNRMADRFKRETGFKGRIEYGYERMRLGSFEGNFTDIPFSPDADTLAFRQACERIIDKILPYSSAKRSQLSQGKISSRWGRTTTDYRQQVNGYRVEGSGFIMITYEAGRKYFSIGDNTVELPDGDVRARITKDTAVNTAKEYHSNRFDLNIDTLIPYEKVKLEFSNPDNNQYTLRYFVIIGNMGYYVNASTGTLYPTQLITDYLSSLLVKGRMYTPFNNNNLTYIDVGLINIETKLNGSIYHTDLNGIFQFPHSVVNSYQTNMKCGYFGVSDYSDSLKLFYYDQINHDQLNPDQYVSTISDSCKIGSVSILSYASNIYTHALDHINQLKTLNSSYSVTDKRIITNYQFSNPSVAGSTNCQDDIIRIRTGLYQSIVRHEFGHDFVYKTLGSNYFNTNLTQGRASSEAFAHYLSCSTVPTSSMVLPSGANYNAVSLQNNQHIDVWQLGLITENIYSSDTYGFNLASAWWSLRGNSLFPNDNQGVNGVDTLLVAGLEIVRRDIADNAAYRYKPRYFYNILMSRTATDTINWVPNPKQEAINKAYSDRGFHFYPKVKSISQKGFARDKFNMGDTLRIEISEAPQNTPFKVYVVKHGEYQYTDGNPMPLQSIMPSGFARVDGRTDTFGNNTLNIWSIPANINGLSGAYDIIVDFGSPAEADGVLRFAFKADNVLDGIDGRINPGFVIPQALDLVLALDCSGSMVANLTDMARTARQIVAQLRPQERVGVFAFALNPDGESQYIRKMIPNNTYGLECIGDNYQALCGDLGTGIYFPGVIDYSNFWTDMTIPFYNGINWFDEAARPKHFLTISDGWQCLPNANSEPHNPSNGIQSLISASYLPDIQCHTMRYKAHTTNNNGPFPYNEVASTALMNDIAKWGNGFSWSRDNVSSLFWDINAILDNIRNGTSTVDQRGRFSDMGDFISIPFSVDKDAVSLTTAFCTDWFSNTNPLNFQLISPNGYDYMQDPNYSHFYTSIGRVNVPYPEEGIWVATLERPELNTSVNSYSFSAHIESNLEVTIAQPPRKHQLNLPLQLSVEVKDYLTPIPNAEVVATLIRDTLYTVQTNLYDDGYHGDEAANDGIYGNYLYAFPEATLHTHPEGLCDLQFEINVPSYNAVRVKRYCIEMESSEPIVYPLICRPIHEGWNWVGYPRLQRDSIGASIDYANVSLSPFLTDIVSSEGIAEYLNNHWNYYGLNVLNSIDGYKLRINEGDDHRLFELGTLIDTLMVHHLYEGQWNWLTYPCYETVYPWEALSGVIDRIDYIMAEDWSMKRDGDIWLHDGFTRPNLRYGDSIMIRATRNSTFVWNNPLTTPVVTDPQKPRYFTYLDKADYETIMIEAIEGNPEYSEIGIYQDEVCIGARVNEAYPIQILAYSTPENEGGGELSFRLYSESKGLLFASPTSMNPNNDDILMPEFRGFRSFTLKTSEDQVPPNLILLANYPNPFNPTTTISFSLPCTAKVKLCIYNVKGQRINEIISRTMESGKHSIIWNGKDERGRGVGSGIYFAKLEQNGQTKISKMMLMK